MYLLTDLRVQIVDALNDPESVVDRMESLLGTIEELALRDDGYFVQHLSDLCCRISRSDRDEIPHILVQMAQVVDCEIQHGLQQIASAPTTEREQESEEASSIARESFDPVPSPPKQVTSTLDESDFLSDFSDEDFQAEQNCENLALEEVTALVSDLKASVALVDLLPHASPSTL